MKEVVVMERQTPADIAVLMCGAVEAVGEIAELNGIDVTERLEDGMVLKIPETVYNKKVVEFCELKGVETATEPGSDIGGVFSDEFSKEFI